MGVGSKVVAEYNLHNTYVCSLVLFFCFGGTWLKFGNYNLS